MGFYYKDSELIGNRGPDGPDGNPIGAVISFMGTTAPEDYLICDGTAYSIGQYPVLANFFKEQFGTSNYFGGDGTTTFAVPNLPANTDTLNCIKAVITKQKDYTGEVYSTEEIRIGTWIDGSPIYRKTFFVQLVVGNVSVPANGAYFLLRYYGSKYGGTDSQPLTDAGNYAYLDYATDSFIIYNQYPSWTELKFAIVFEYTKKPSTDASTIAQLTLLTSTVELPATHTLYASASSFSISMGSYAAIASASTAIISLNNSIKKED